MVKFYDELGFVETTLTDGRKIIVFFPAICYQCNAELNSMRDTQVDPETGATYCMGCFFDIKEDKA